jgi:hypothetical protein
VGALGNLYPQAIYPHYPSLLEVEDLTMHSAALADLADYYAWKEDADLRHLPYQPAPGAEADHERHVPTYRAAHGAQIRRLALAGGQSHPAVLR